MNPATQYVQDFTIFAGQMRPTPFILLNTLKIFEYQ
jgi:hypothetical protein